MGVSSKYLLLVAIAILVLLPTGADAFGAGNIASISKIEGKNWRHGDIEDMLATVACLRGHKWKSNMIKVQRVDIERVRLMTEFRTARLLRQLATRLFTGCRYCDVGQSTGRNYPHSGLGALVYVLWICDCRV
jgi:hypothetical protein